MMSILKLVLFVVWLLPIVWVLALYLNQRLRSQVIRQCEDGVFFPRFFRATVHDACSALEDEAPIAVYEISRHILDDPEFSVRMKSNPVSLVDSCDRVGSTHQVTLYMN